jgi:sulfite reductase (ferredoxin)
MPQKQPGFNLVAIKIPLGDIKSAQVRAVADICERFSDSYIRVNVQQNFAMRWVHEADLPAVHEALTGIGLAEAGADRIENIVSCPGTDSCGLSITSSKGLARSLSGLFPAGDPVNDDLAGMSLKVSGCQNACAQHQLASIGFHGVGKKVGGHTAPFYELHLGGSNSLIGLQVLKIPAKRALGAVKHMVQWYRTGRQGSETFEQFVQRMGKDKLKESLMPFTFLPSYEEDRSFYVDWGDEKDFTTEDLGPGECAGGAYEMMEGFLFEADQELHLAGVMAEKGQTGHAVNKAYRAIVAAAKGLLVLEGVDSSIDAEILFKAETLLVGKEILPRAFARLTDQVKDLGPKSPTVEFAREKITYAKSFVEASHSAFDKHGRSLKLAKTHTAEPPEAVEKPVRGLPTTTPATIRLDLSGVACPINYVKTKLKLEELEVGQHLEVILDDGEPIRNVPKSLQGDGQKILSQEKIDEQHYRLLVEKVN